MTCVPASRAFKIGNLNPDKPEKIATKAQRRTVYYILTTCLGVLVAKIFF
jgi:hypothetical protein